MPGTFSKSILKVGTYHSPDGVVEVTPERLRHWANETKRLQSVGYAIPSHFDHSNEVDLLEPVAMGTLAAKTSRSAAATVGKLKDIRVASDGQSAEITIETMTPKATEAVKANTVYVSPVIFPEWRDGAGNEYRDVITSFDLVDHPVDHSQTSFIPTRMGIAATVPFIRMGVNSQPFRLGASTTMANPIRMGENDPAQGFFTTPGGAVRPITSEVRDDDVYESKPSKKWTKQQKKRNGRRRKKMSLIRMGSDENEFPPANDENANDDAIDAPEEYDVNAVVDDGDDFLDEVLILLQDFGITLPEDTTDDNLIDRLRVALTAQCKSKQDEDDANAEGQADEPVPVAASPQIATMSLQNQALIKYARDQYAAMLNNRLAALLRNGQCKPNEADQQKRSLATVKLSLNSQGQPAKGMVEQWIESREVVPKGTFWTDEQKTTAYQKLSVVEAPTSWSPTQQLTQKQIEEGVAALTRGRR